MTRLQWPLLVLLALAWVAQAGQPSTDLARFQHADGFTATGTFWGGCDVSGYRPAPRVGSQELTAGAASLSIVRTWRNDTIIGPGGPIPTSYDTRVEQKTYAVPIPSGRLALNYEMNSHWYLARNALDPTRSMNATLLGSEWVAQSPQWTAPAGPFRYYMKTSEGTLLAVDPGIPGPTRYVQTNDGPVHVSGSGYVFFDQLTVRGHDFEYVMPPFREDHYVNETPASVEWHVLFTYGVLIVDDLRISVDAVTGHLACSSLDMRGTGEVTYRRASGTVTRGDIQKTFTEREFTMTGDFDSHENIPRASRAAGEDMKVLVNSTGSFSSVQLDFQRVELPAPLRIHIPAAVPIVVAVLAALGVFFRSAVAAFFTRLQKEPALSHPLRALIHETVLQRPGLTLAELERVVNRGKSVVRHHAFMLHYLGLIQKTNDGGRVRLFSVGLNRTTAMQTAVLNSDEKVRYLVEFLRPSGGLQAHAAAALAERFGTGKATAWKVIQRAREASLLKAEITDAGVFLRPTN